MWFWITTLIVFGHLGNGIWSNAISVVHEGYVFTAGIGYHKIHSQAKISDSARSICQREGGDLAIIDSDQESQIILALFTLSLPHIGSYDSNYTLVGFHDRIVDVQYPTIQVENGESVDYNQRGLNKPSIARRYIENCDAIDRSGRVNSISCHQPYAFVCERPEYEKEICGKAVVMNVTVAKELIIEEGEVSIACNVVGHPASRILWYKDDELIQTNDRINISEGNDLIIPRANKNDAGKYRCETANEHESGAHTVDIKVIVPVKVRIAVDDGPFPKGSNISMVCNADGYPIPTVRWYKDDDQIRNNEKINIVANKLIIFTAEKDDAGKYRCEAANDYTSSAETVDIKVAAPIKVTMAASKGPFLKGSEFSISCHIDGHPTPKVLWYKNGTRIQASNGIRISANELIITAADENDTGTYRCEAADEYTGNAETVDIKVIVPVRVRMTVDSGPFSKGSKISITCNTHGYPAPTLYWHKNDKYIEENERINIVANKLIISTAEENDTGTYRCEAANQYTSISDTVNVKVIVPVRVKMAVGNGPFSKGSEISIACNTDGYPTPTVQWYKNYHRIEENKRINIVANKLIISTAEEIDTGTYRCEAANTYTSSAETVDIKVIVPVRVKIAVDNGPFFKESKISIACNTNGYPTPTVKWYKNDNHIEENERINIVANELIISTAEENDAGKYRCEAANEYTSSAETVDIKVAAPIKVTLAAGKSPFLKGSQFNISCHVDGYPTPKVLWYKDGTRIRASNRIRISANELIISTAEENDTGKYRCEAANEYTSSAETVDIGVAVPVRVKMAIDNGAFSNGSKISIACNTDGYPTPTVQWYKNDNHIEENERINIVANELIILTAEENDTGRYRCEAANEYTSSAETVDVKVAAGSTVQETDIEVINSTPTPAPAPSTLPEGYVRFPDLHSAYKVYQEFGTWEQARDKCIAEGAHLAITDTHEKINRILGMGGVVDGWISVGIQKSSTTDNWVRVDNGLPLESIPWNAHHLSDSGDARCSVISLNLEGLYKRHCGYVVSYVCEIPI